MCYSFSSQKSQAVSRSSPQPPPIQGLEMPQLQGNHRCGRSLSGGVQGCGSVLRSWVAGSTWSQAGQAGVQLTGSPGTQKGRKKHAPPLVQAHYREALTGQAPCDRAPASWCHTLTPMLMPTAPLGKKHFAFQRSGSSERAASFTPVHPISRIT